MPWWGPNELDLPDDYYYEVGGDGGGFGPRPVVCKFCRKTGFQWQSTWDREQGKYRYFLVDDRNRLHNCRVSTPNDFEDLTNVVSSTSSSPAARRPVSRPGNAAGARKQAKGRAPSTARRRSERAANSRPQAI